MSDSRILQDAIDMMKGMTGKAREVYDRTEQSRHTLDTMMDTVLGHHARKKLAGVAVVGGAAAVGLVHHQAGDSSGAQTTNNQNRNPNSSYY